MSKNANELKTGAPGRFRSEVSRLGWQWKLESSVMSTSMQPLTPLVVAVSGWVQRDQQACAPQEVDPALIARFRPAMVGCF